MVKVKTGEGEELDFIIDQMGHVLNLPWFGSREDIEHILWHLPEIQDNRVSFDWDYVTDNQTEKIRIFWEIKGRTLEFFGLFDEAFEHYKTNLTIFRHERADDGSKRVREVDIDNYVVNSKARMLIHMNKFDKALQHFDNAIIEDDRIGEGVSHYEKANALVQLGRLDEALNLIMIIEDKEILSDHKELLVDHPRVLYLKHIIFMKQKKYENAIECLDKIIEDFKPSEVCLGCRDFFELNQRISHSIRDHNRIASDIDFYETVLISKIKALLEQDQNAEAMALVDKLLMNYVKNEKSLVIRKDNNYLHHQLLRFKRIPIQPNNNDPNLIPIISHSYQHTRFSDKFRKSEKAMTYKQALNLIRDKFSNCRFTL